MRGLIGIGNIVRSFVRSFIQTDICLPWAGITAEGNVAGGTFEVTGLGTRGGGHRVKRGECHQRKCVWSLERGAGRVL